MSQFDFYKNPNADSRKWAPYLVDLQHELLGSLGTRIMAPLVIADPSDSMMRRLNPLISVGGQTYFLSITEMASVPTKELSAPLGNLSEYRDELMAAVDFLFTAV